MLTFTLLIQSCSCRRTLKDTWTNVFLSFSLLLYIYNVHLFWEELLINCVLQDPAQRPTFKEIIVILEDLLDLGCVMSKSQSQISS